jgi:HEAT repeat protein
MSSITGRSEIISQYLDDPDKRVREEAADALKDRQEQSKK